MGNHAHNMYVNLESAMHSVVVCCFTDHTLLTEIVRGRSYQFALRTVSRCLPSHIGTS